MTSAVFRRSAVALAIVAVAGCSTWDSMTKTGQATTVGAASGAVGGAVVGGPVGAVAGAAIGGVAGHEMARSQESSTTSSSASSSTSTAAGGSTYASSSPSSPASAPSSTGYETSRSGTTASAPSTSDAGSSQSGAMAMGNTPSSSNGGKVQGTHTMSRDTYLRAVQQSLNDQGYDAGKVDGIWGPKTAAALKRFQAEHGLEPSGQIDAQTISALGIAQPAESNTTGAASSSEKAASASLDQTAANAPK